MCPLIVDFHVGLKKENEAWFAGKGISSILHPPMSSQMAVKESKSDGM
jgi:hypothetical protein